VHVLNEIAPHNSPVLRRHETERHDGSDFDGQNRACSDVHRSGYVGSAERFGAGWLDHGYGFTVKQLR